MSNPLADVLPLKVRRYTYAVAFVLLIIWTCIQGAEGDWSKVIGGVLTSLVPLLAVSNTPAEYDGTIDPYLAEATTGAHVVNIPEMKKRLNSESASPKVDQKTVLLKVKQPDFAK